MRLLKQELKSVEQKLRDLESQKGSSQKPGGTATKADPKNTKKKIDLEIEQTYEQVSLLKIRYLMDNL